MAIVNLTSPLRTGGGGAEDLVIVRYIDGVRGGRSLNVETFKPAVIRAGHLIIQEISTGEYYPMPVKADGSGYDVIPTGYKYVGVAVGSTLKSAPLVGIMTRGTVNPACAPYPMTDELVTALLHDLPHIDFRKD